MSSPVECSRPTLVFLNESKNITSLLVTAFLSPRFKLLSTAAILVNDVSAFDSSCTDEKHHIRASSLRRRFIKSNVVLLQRYWAFWEHFEWYIDNSHHRKEYYLAPTAAPRDSYAVERHKRAPRDRLQTITEQLQRPLICTERSLRQEWLLPRHWQRSHQQVQRMQGFKSILVQSTTANRATNWNGIAMEWWDVLLEKVV